MQPLILSLILRHWVLLCYMLWSTNMHGLIGKTKFQKPKLTSCISQNFPDSTSFLNPVCSSKNQTSYSAKLLAQWKVTTTQPSLSIKQLSKLSIYASLSSFNTFDSTLPSPTRNLKAKTHFQFCPAFSYPQNFSAFSRCIRNKKQPNCPFKKQTSQSIYQFTSVLIYHISFYPSTQLLLVFSPPNPLLFLSICLLKNLLSFSSNLLFTELLPQAILPTFLFW